jgi:hypothetical protein
MSSVMVVVSTLLTYLDAFSNGPMRLSAVTRTLRWRNFDDDWVCAFPTSVVCGGHPHADLEAPVSGSGRQLSIKADNSDSAALATHSLELPHAVPRLRGVEKAQEVFYVVTCLGPGEKLSECLDPVFDSVGQDRVRSPPGRQKRLYRMKSIEVSHFVFMC